jgi:hypothetical protein
MPNTTTDGDWEANKSRILDLYVVQGKTLLGDGGVIQEMGRYGLTAT